MANMVSTHLGMQQEYSHLQEKINNLKKLSITNKTTTNSNSVIVNDVTIVDSINVTDPITTISVLLPETTFNKTSQVI